MARIAKEMVNIPSNCHSERSEESPRSGGPGLRFAEILRLRLRMARLAIIHHLPKVRLPRLAWVLISATLSAAMVFMAFAGTAFASENAAAAASGDQSTSACNLVFATMGVEESDDGAVSESESRLDGEHAEAPSGGSDAVNGSSENADAGRQNFPLTGEDGLASTALAVSLLACAGVVMRFKLA